MDAVRTAPVDANAVGNIENLVTLTAGQYTSGSLILMVSYGAHFAFILYFLMTSMQLAPRYRVVPIISAVVMASAGLSLLREFTTWQETYEFVGGMAWHFARSDSGMDLLPRLAIAGLAVGGSALLRPHTTASVFTAALGEAPPTLLLLLLAVGGGAALLAAATSMALRRHGAASAGLAALVCFLFHPVLAVGLIFFGMHALPVQQRQVARYGTAQVFKVIALPTAVATLAAAAVALAVWNGWLALELAVAIAFGMATPHMLTERLER